MKKLIYVTVIVVFFLLGLSFFLNNPQTVELNYYGLLEGKKIPLAMLLLVVFFVGVIVGYFSSLLRSLKLRRNLSKANRTIQNLESTQV